jgi:hypothetical protein
MKVSTTWITSISFLIGASAVRIAAFSQINFKAAATASNISPALTKLSDKSYLLTWTDNSTVYVSCYPTVKPRMKPAPIKQTPNRYVITCKNK